MPKSIRRLNEIELDCYDVLPIELARKVWVLNVPFLFGRYTGLTLRKLILLAEPVSEDGLSNLLAHELVHVRQWHELGFTGFMVRYLCDFCKCLRTHRNWDAAYSSIKVEEQARHEAKENLAATVLRRRGAQNCY